MFLSTKISISVWILLMQVFLVQSQDNCQINETAINLEDRNCFISCDTDADCRNKRASCLCDGSCGMSCIPPGIECTKPESLENGEILLPESLEFGSSISYKCNDGYELIGPRMRICNAERYFGGEPPVCIPVANYYPTSSTPLIQENIGDEMVTEEFQILNSSSEEDWSYEDGEKQDINNKEVLGNHGESCLFEMIRNTIAFYKDSEIKRSGNYSSGSELKFRCRDIGKFVFSGKPIVQCLNGKWNNAMPKCTKLNPGNRNSAPMFEYEVETEDFVIEPDGTLVINAGDTLKLSCVWFRYLGEPNWIFRKTTEISTELPGEWNEERTMYQLIKTDVTEDNSGIYQCMNPRTKASNSISVRVVQKIVSTTRMAILTTEVIIRRSNIEAEVPEAPNLEGKSEICILAESNNGIFKNVTNNEPLEVGTVIENKETVILECEEGYAVDRDVTNEELQCRNGKFYPPNVSCWHKGSFCPTNETAINVQNRNCFAPCNINEDCSNQRATCLCDGACGMTCIHPGIKCRKPAKIPNGQIMFPETLAFGSKITYKCNDGYKLIGSRERTCNAEKYFDGKAPICVAEGCRKPEFLHGYMAYKSGNIGRWKKRIGPFLLQDDRIKFTCRQNFDLILHGNIVSINVVIAKCNRGKWININADDDSNVESIPICEGKTDICSEDGLDVLPNTRKKLYVRGDIINVQCSNPDQIGTLQCKANLFNESSWLWIHPC